MRSAASKTIFQINELEAHPITSLSLSKHICLLWIEGNERTDKRVLKGGERNSLRGGFIEKKGRTEQRLKIWLL